MVAGFVDEGNAIAMEDWGRVRVNVSLQILGFGGLRQKQGALRAVPLPEDTLKQTQRDVVVISDTPLPASKLGADPG